MKIPAAYLTTPTPFYAYHKSIILKQAECLNQLHNFSILYSVKTNPFPPILQTMAKLHYGADAASASEVNQSLLAGIPAEKIYYSAPGKTRTDLEDTWGKCRLIADSFHELHLCDQIASEKGELLSVGLRIHPPFSMGHSAPLPSKFGIDWEQILSKKDFLRSLKHLRIDGIHIHLRSQVLDAETLLSYYQNILDLSLEMERVFSISLDYINFGSGIGIVYDPSIDSPFDFSAFQKNLDSLLLRYRPKLKAKFLLESGRFLVGTCGNYITEIVDIKTSQNKTYYIVKNGANGFFRPVLKELLQKDGNVPTAAEPFYTHQSPCQVHLLAFRESTEQADIVGHLCTAQDVMMSNIILPKGTIGDRILFTNAGSYGFSLSPLKFASQPLPQQIWLEDE